MLIPKNRTILGRNRVPAKPEPARVYLRGRSAYNARCAAGRGDKCSRQTISDLDVEVTTVKYQRAAWIGMALVMVGIGGAARAEEAPGWRERNERAVAEVAAGTRAEASAAWWGFNREDATDTLQAALDSSAKRLVIPYMGEPWIVRPLKAHGDQTIIFEPGVLLLAKKGEYKSKGDSMFVVSDGENLTMRGYGATLRMRKKDYQNPPYEKAEWRMGIGLHGCKNVLVEGLRIEGSGGDGIYLDAGKRGWCEDVTIRNVTCYDNHRQGISVISARNLLVEGCSLSGTKGTAPESGIDLEPDVPENVLTNCVIRDCVFENNAGNAAAVYLKPLTRKSEPVSIIFENCVSRMGKPGDSAEVVEAAQLGGWGGFAVGAIKDDGPQGLIEFRHCVSENTGKEGARIYDNSSESVKIRFVDCAWKNAWLDNPLDDNAPRAPISITLRRPKLTEKFGGVEFVDCHVYDTKNRPAIIVHEDESQFGIRGISGRITVHNPNGARGEFGVNPQNVAPDLVRAVGE